MFITLEGAEGAGKTTLLKSLEKKFIEEKRNVCTTREPGGSSLGAKLRPLILSEKEEKVCSRAELLLFLADRAEHVEKIIKPALAENKIVLCDRYIHSTLAYQGFGRGLNLDFLKTLNDFATENCTPDLTFILDIDIEVGLNRAIRRNTSENIAEGKFEAEEKNFHEKVRQGFLTMAEQSKITNKKIIVLDANQCPENIFNQAWQVIGCVPSCC